MVIKYPENMFAIDFCTAIGADWAKLHFARVDPENQMWKVQFSIFFKSDNGVGFVVEFRFRTCPIHILFPSPKQLVGQNNRATRKIRIKIVSFDLSPFVNWQEIGKNRSFAHYRNV